MKKKLSFSIAIILLIALSSSINHLSETAPPPENAPVAYQLVITNVEYNCDYLSQSPNDCENGWAPSYHWSNRTTGWISLSICYEILCDITTEDGVYSGIMRWIECREEFDWKINVSSGGFQDQGTWNIVNSPKCGPPEE